MNEISDGTFATADFYDGNVGCCVCDVVEKGIKCWVPITCVVETFMPRPGISGSLSPVSVGSTKAKHTDQK